MHNVSVQKSEDLSAAVKSALESLLGRALEPGEEVSIMTFRPHAAPQGSERDDLAKRLRAQMDEMAGRSGGASEQELDEILDEAMRSARPDYRRVK